MKCFYHNSADAVGICKNCNKGVCVECAFDMTNGLACRNSCESEVTAINQIIDRGKNSHQKTSSGYVSSALFLFLMGILFSVAGAIDYSESSKFAGFSMPAGVIFFFSAAMMWWMSRKYKAK